MKWNITATILFLTAALAAMSAQGPTIPSADGVYVVLRLSDRAEPDLLAVTTAGGPRWAEVAPKAQTTLLPNVRSLASANDRFAIDYTYAYTGTCGPSMLRANSEWFFWERSSASATAANALGATSRGCLVHGEIADRTGRLANQIAAILGTTPTLWVLTGERVTGTFAAAKPVFRASEDVEILFTMRNPSDAQPLNRNAFGQGAGPRWAFQVRRDGRPLNKLGRAGSASSTSVAFGPGESVTLRVRLKDFSSDVGMPGHYIVDCDHTEHFSALASGQDRGNPGGDQRFTGVVEFDIQP